MKRQGIRRHVRSAKEQREFEQLVKTARAATIVPRIVPVGYSRRRRAVVTEQTQVADGERQ